MMWDHWVGLDVERIKSTPPSFPRKRESVFEGNRDAPFHGHDDYWNDGTNYSARDHTVGMAAKTYCLRKIRYSILQSRMDEVNDSASQHTARHATGFTKCEHPLHIAHARN